MTKQISNKVPEIRFRRFKNEWVEEPILSRITKIIDFRGRTPKKLGLDWSESGYLALSALNVKDGYIDYSADAHFGDDQLYNVWMQGHELHSNQVLFTTEAPMGNVAQVPDNQKYILSQRTIAFVTDPLQLSEDYLATLLKSPSVFSQLLARSSGGTAKGVSQKSLSTLNVILSNDIDEQTKVGYFFKKLDQLIQLHQYKHTKLITLKQAMLIKMFPQKGAKVPDIRFKGFSGDWAEVPFHSITSKTTQSCSDVNLPRLEYEDIISNTGLLNKDLLKKKSNKKGIKFEKGDVLFGKLRPYLKNWLLASFEGIAVGDFWVLRSSKTSPLFLYQLIQTEKFDIIANQSAGSKMPRSDWNLILPANSGHVTK